MKQALLIIAKRPATGKTKTRLHPTLSGQEAALLYESFLQDMLENTEDPPAGVGYWYLARRRTAGGAQSYDVPFAGQVASRDTAIDASPLGCP